MGTLADADAFAILDALPAWLLVVDADLRIRFANHSFLGAKSLDAERVIDRPLSELVTEGMEDGEAALVTVRQALSEQRFARLASVRYREDRDTRGRVHDLEATPFVLAGRPSALLVLHDVSEHWWSRETARREKRKLEDIVNGMGAALAVIDPDLKVQWANRAFHEWFGEMYGRRFDYALRGLILVGDTDPERIFTQSEYVSREWAHFTARGDKRYFRNIILPSHDAEGRLVELILVTQDLTELTLRSEQHLLLRDLAHLLQSTLDLDRLLYIILTCATAGHALGFNRAFIFLAEEEGVLQGRMGVGPSSHEEAFTIWADLASSRKSLGDLTADYDEFRSSAQKLTRIVNRLTYSLGKENPEGEIVARTAIEDRVQLVRDSERDPRVSNSFRQLFGAREFVSVPLRSKGKVVGVLLADNVYSGRQISSEQFSMLELFAAQAGLAVDNARTYLALKRSKESLEKAQEAVIQAERLATVGRLAAHVAHEIRNPLTTVGGYARSMLRTPEDQEWVVKSATVIFDEVRRLEGILSGVMDFTRPSRPDRRPGQVNHVVQRLAATMADELREKGVNLELGLEESLPDHAFDEPQLHQVLLNLLRNALDSLTGVDRPSSAPPRIVIRTYAENQWVHVAVEDNGSGMPEDLLPNLFEPFISRREGGTGLGLAVVRKIMLDHGGDATGRNRAEGGALFVLSLPIGLPPAEA